MIPKIIHYCWLGDSFRVGKMYSNRGKRRCLIGSLFLWDKNCLKDLNSDWVNEHIAQKNMLSRRLYTPLASMNKFGRWVLFRF